MNKPQIHWRDLQKERLQQIKAGLKKSDVVNGLELKINPKVYPIGTDTKVLARSLVINSGDECLDLCTGTGAIAFVLSERGAGHVLGIDINRLAVDNAEQNKLLLGFNNVDFKVGNLFAGIKEKYDVITINPPYTDVKPHDDFEVCFYDEGHKLTREFFVTAKHYLKPNGKIYLAWSNLGPMDLLPKLAQENGLMMKQINQDTGRNGYHFYVYELRM